MRYLRYFWIVLFVLTSCTLPTTQNIEQANTLFIQANGDQQQIQEAFRIATKVLAENPSNPRNLNVHATIAAHLQEYALALQDYQKLNEVQPSAFNKLTECMLQERLQSATPPIECYRQASSMYKSKQLKDQDVLNNAVASLLANEPQAQSEAQELIMSAQTGPLQDSYKAVLENFDRKTFIQSVFP